MALRTKLKTLTDSLPEGSEWYCFQVPEEYHVWAVNNKWQTMEAYGVIPVRIKVRGTASESQTNTTKISKKSPKKLNCGVEVSGQRSSGQSLSFIWDLRVDGIREINDALTELAHGDDYVVTSFTVSELEVFNKVTGVSLICENHNPDGNGTSLYIVAFHVGGEVHLYPTIAVGTMDKYVSDFKGKFAQCSNVMAMQHGCLIKNKIKKTQIKRRKKIV